MFMTMVTIIKENLRATDNRAIDMATKNKDKKQWRLGCELGDYRLDPIGDSIVTPYISH
jgi:hypothetical protein